jgi:hypothetical protein
MTTPSHRRRAALAFAVGAAVPLLLVAAGTAPAFADEMGPSPAPGPSPYAPPFTGGGPATDMIIDVPGPQAPEPILSPFYIYQNVVTGGLSLAQANPGYGWQQFSGPYATYADGGADMNAFGVAGWEAF